MRNPRLEPHKGDVLEHHDGERRVVVAKPTDAIIRYGDRDSKLVSECSTAEWQEWAKNTSILDFGSD